MSGETKVVTRQQEGEDRLNVFAQIVQAALVAKRRRTQRDAPSAKQRALPGRGHRARMP